MSTLLLAAALLAVTPDNPAVFVPTGREDPELVKQCRTRLGIPEGDIPTIWVRYVRRCVLHLKQETPGRTRTNALRDQAAIRQVKRLSQRFQHRRVQQLRLQKHQSARSPEERKSLKEKLLQLRSERRNLLRTQERTNSAAIQELRDARREIRLGCRKLSTPLERKECIWQQLHNLNVGMQKEKTDE